MVVKSHGKHKRTREKFRGPKKLTVNDFLKQFEVGQSVALLVNSNSERGQPFRRFYGKTGKIIEKRGSCYVVQVRDGSKFKKITAAPEHLKKV